MAGHNKWSKIKHRKAVVDSRRGKVWTKVAKAIIVAAKNGGADPSSNLSLRYAIDEARYANMPRDTIERAIKKGAGAGAGEDFVPVRYEGYAPGGVAVIVDTLTNNRTRTIGDVRLIFSTHGGSVGANGCVTYLFEPRGRIGVRGDDSIGERLMEAAIAADAEDVTPPDPGTDAWQVLTPVPAFQAVKEAIERAGLTIVEAEIAMVPGTSVRVSGPDVRTLIALVEALEDNDDVQKVYTNADLDDDAIASLG